MARSGSVCPDASNGVIIGATRPEKGDFMAGQYEFGKTTNQDSISHCVNRQGIPVTGIRFDSSVFIIEKKCYGFNGYKR